MRTAFTELVGVEHPLVGFNRSPAVVAEVSKAGALGVLAATAYRPEELDAQLTWIEEQIGDTPYGVDLLIPAKLAKGDPNDLIASLRAQIPEEHIRFVEELMVRYGIPPRVQPAPEASTCQRSTSIRASSPSSSTWRSRTGSR